MFQHLKSHKKILVTGPHRAGTTIAATMIAHDTQSFLALEEKCWLPGQDLQLLDWWMNDYKGSVVCQAPFAADQCHVYKNALVVFMHRDLSDIKKSQQRMFSEDHEDINWERIQRAETRKYHTGQLGRPIAQIKYEQWQEQKQDLPYHLDLEYESLKDHELWVDKEDRKAFHVRQTIKQFQASFMTLYGD